MKTQIFIIIAVLLTAPLLAQPLTKHWIQFKDKKDNPYSIDKPEEYLSARAIERRKRYNIEIDETDLPVNPSYLNEIKNAGGVIYTTSKWFNAATVYAEDDILAKIKELPFVLSTEPVGRYTKANPSRSRPKVRGNGEKYVQYNEHYGHGDNQIKMLNGDLLHNMGFDGDGMMVAVLDGGFTNVDIMPFFDTLRANGRILEGWDMVDNDSYVYESSSHGTQVLSTMAANLPGLLIGTAPDATYVCIKTEDVRSELRIEEDNWVAGAEYADSLGVDVINSSLGYTTFNIQSMSHTYEDMDGKTSRATIGADMAASKGMLIVVSAGNEGGGKWKYMGAPADGDDVFAIGGVDRSEKRASFSSQGPTFDGRVKPNVMARGAQSIVASLYAYEVDSANGTSFASPILAGMVTSLWQAFPEKTNIEIMRAIEKSSDNYHTPNGKTGYGLPDFYKAYRILSGEDISSEKTQRPGAVQRVFIDAFFESTSDKVIKP
jgi:serine protease AprX